MKKQLRSFMFLAFLLTVLLPFNGLAIKHVVNVQNYSFSPSNINNVQIGDTIRWVWVSGVHTTTSSSIPAGAASWDSPITSTVTSYEYRVTAAGSYSYVCTPHAGMGMTGTFTVVAGATLTVTPNNRNVSATAGSTTFSVTSNSNWTAVSNQPWCTVTPSGSGNGTITANYTANTATSQRIATITVTVSGLPSQMVTVTQAGAAATLSVQPPNQDVSAGSGSTTFSVTSNSSWTSGSNQSWCTVNPSGSGNGTITANYTENTSVMPRMATITVTVSGIPSETVTVSQAGAAPTLNVGPTDQTVSYESGSVNYDVTSNTDWTAQSNTEWCTVTPSGTGDGTIVADYSENLTAEVRVTTITVSVSGLPDQMVILSQEAAPISVKEVNLPALRLFPNPANNQFAIDLSGKVRGNALLSIFTMNGEVVFEELIRQGSDISVDVASLPSGTYITKLISGNNIWQERLVIIH
jgi:plastocyanin